MSRILLVEDEPGLRVTLADRLGRENYALEMAADGEVGLKLAREQPFDLIVLDVMLPGKSGLEVCHELRQGGSQTPVLMLTARGQTTDKVLGLKLGADDYLVKPFEMAELLARIEALLRRGANRQANTPVYVFGDVKVDVRRAEVTRDGQQIPLSAKEFQLLRYFLEHRQEAVSREELLHQVWGYDRATSTRTVDVHVAWLRQKVEEQPKRPVYILTVHGIGYKFVG